MGDVGRISLIVVVLSFFWASYGVISFGDLVPVDFGSLWKGIDSHSFSVLYIVC